MARTAITPQRISSSGLAPQFESANADGNSFRLAEHRYLHVKNGSGGSINVTIPTPLTVDGLAVTDRVVAVPAAGERLFALGIGTTYKQTGGVAHVDYSAATSVTVAVFDA